MQAELDIIVDQVLGTGGSSNRTPVYAHKIRDLGKEDIAKLWSLKEGDLKEGYRPTTSVLKIRESHHALARLVAEGRKNVEIAAISGYTPTYVSMLKDDPAFKSLVDHYKEAINVIYTTVHERMASISMLAAEELQERLTEKPEEFSRRELLEVVEKTADRTGFGPRTTQVNVNLDLADRLQKARSRAELGADVSPPSALNGPQLHESLPLTLELRPNKEPVE